MMHVALATNAHTAHMLLTAAAAPRPTCAPMSSSLPAAPALGGPAVAASAAAFSLTKRSCRMRLVSWSIRACAGHHEEGGQQKGGPSL